MQRALVTGCNGFVGRVMAARLRVGGYEVRGVDRVESCDVLDGGAYLSGDLRDPGFVAEAIEASDLDCIVHLAAQSSVRRSFDEPASTLSDGTLPALNVLNHIRESGEKTRVLLIGSADEYGVVPAGEMPIAETHAVSQHRTQWFKGEGDAILLIGATASAKDLGGSEWLKLATGKICGDAPALNLKKERAVQDLVLAGIRKNWIRSAHDCSEGGLAVALGEACMTGPQPLGAMIEMGGGKRTPLEVRALLFAETQSRILVTVKESDLQSLLKAARVKKVPTKVIGKVTGKSLNIKGLVDVPVRELEAVWSSGFETSVFGSEV